MSANDTETRVKAAHINLPIASLSAYLASLGIHGQLEVLQFKQGQSNPTFLLKIKDEKYVLRKKPDGKILDKSAHDVLREHAIMKALDGRIPVPKMLVGCTDTSILGTEFYIMEFLKGRIFSDVSLVNVPHADRRSIWFELVWALAKLHKVNPLEIRNGIEESWFNGRSISDFHGFYPRQIRKLGLVSSKQASVDGTPAIPDLSSMLEWFLENIIADETTIIHGDYKMDNVVFSSNSTQIIGILDWELSTCGHPLSDLANLLLPFYIDGEFGPIKGLRHDKAVNVPSKEELMKEYCKLTGRIYPIPNWNFCVAFSFFRMAVILQGVSARLKRGQASSAQAEIFAKLTVPSADYAWELIRNSSSSSNGNNQKSNL